MTSFWRIFWLEFTGLVRSRTLAMLTVAGVLWMLVFPSLVKGDGTTAGARELYVHFSLGGVFVLLVVSLLASATGSLASERTARRLQLTMVRPVRYIAIALGKILAHVAAGAFVLACACLVLALKSDLARPCSHVLSPVLPTPREEALAMYASYMADPETPEMVRRAKRDVVLRLLEQRASDHYQTVSTNETALWTFALPPLAVGAGASVAVRMRFTNQMEMRQDVVGDFRFGDLSASVSNMTQAVLEIPLGTSAEALAGKVGLSFANRGKSAVMLRPRKDLSLLIPADTFGANLLRAFLVLVALLTAVVSAGVFLSAALGRPVALFVAFVALVVGEMSPSVLDQYPDSLETGLADRIGLHISRFAATVTRPVSAASPLESLARDECVEPSKAAELAVVDFLAVPLAFSLLAAFVLPRKQED